jgi:hypothetical protein
MSYFNKFPLIEYTFDSGKTTKIGVDILKRVGFKESIKNTIELFSEYEIIDGETPEMVSNKIYGDPSLHWVIMLMNDIVNPYYDWPLSTRVLNKSNTKVKYPGVALMLTDHTGTTAATNSYFTKDDQIYGVEGNTFSVDAYGVVDGLTATTTAAKINKWDTTFQKLEVVGMSGSFSVGDYLTTVGVSGDLESDGSYVYTVARIGRIVSENKDSVHHFADSTGDYLNPYATPPSSGTGDQTLLGQTGSWNGGATVEYGDTILQNYIIDSTDVYTVTNYQHEETQNESKRSIRIISPRYVSKIIEEFERTIK